MSGLEPYLPEDFDAFWRETVAEVADHRLDYHRSLVNDYDLPGFTVETVDFSVLGGRRLNGWLAYAPGARRAPGFVWIPPYGRESLLPNAYGTREGLTSLSFNFFGHGAFHQEGYVQSRGYFSEGAGSPETFVFRRMFQDAFLATKVLEAQLEVDEDRIGAMGLSQGGGMAIWLGAFCPAIRAVCADLPFFGAIARTLIGSVYRYPLKELADFMENEPVGRERVLNTVPYFDTMNVATRCRVPTHVSLGLKDPAVRPESAQAVFDALPGEKALKIYDGGHDWNPEMIETNRRWLLEKLG